MSLSTPFSVCLKDNKECVGIAVSESVWPQQMEDGSIKPVATIGVLWGETRSPNPSYHAPDELEWLEVMHPALMSEEEEDEDLDEEDDEGIEDDLEEDEGDEGEEGDSNE